MIRRVAFSGALNFRDIGGYPTRDGSLTRWGVVYRSDSLHYLTAEDLPVFDALGIQAIYDLRRPSEAYLLGPGGPARVEDGPHRLALLHGTWLRSFRVG